MKGHQTLDKDEREKGRNAVFSYLAGKRKNIPLIDDVYKDLEFEELQKELEDGEPTNAEKAEFQFKLALLRSLKYSVAGSNHCRALGFNNEARQLYEGQRLAAHASSE